MPYPDFTLVVENATARPAINAIGKLAEEAILKVGNEGITSEVVDAGNVASVGLDWPAASMESYDAEPGSFGIDIKAFEDALGDISKRSKVEIKGDASASEVVVSEFGSGGSGTTIDMFSPDAARNPPDIPQLDWTAEFTVPGDDFSRVVRASKKVSDHIALGVVPENPEDRRSDMVFRTRAEGDTDTLVGWPEADFSDGMKPRDPTASLYSITYIDSIRLAVDRPASTDVNIKLASDEMPIQVSFTVGSAPGAELTFFLAPRIQSDDVQVTHQRLGDFHPSEHPLGSVAWEADLDGPRGKALFNALGTFTDEYKVLVNDLGFESRAIDPANVALRVVEANPAFFDSFTEGEGFPERPIGLAGTRIIDMLKMWRKRDDLEIAHDPSTRFISLKHPQFAVQLATIDPDSIRSEPDLPDLTLSSEVEADVEQFTAAFEDADAVTDQMYLVVSDGELFVIGIGDDKTVTRHVDTVAGRGQGITLLSGEYLERVVDSIPALDEDTVTVRIGNEFPGVFFSQTDDGTLDLFRTIAPRVVSDGIASGTVADEIEGFGVSTEWLSGPESGDYEVEAFSGIERESIEERMRKERLSTFPIDSWVSYSPLSGRPLEGDVDGKLSVHEADDMAVSDGTIERLLDEVEDALDFRYIDTGERVANVTFTEEDAYDLEFANPQPKVDYSLNSPRSDDFFGVRFSKVTANDNDYAYVSDERQTPSRQQVVLRVTHDDDGEGYSVYGGLKPPGETAEGIRGSEIRSDYHTIGNAYGAFRDYLDETPIDEIILDAGGEVTMSNEQLRDELGEIAESIYNSHFMPKPGNTTDDTDIYTSIISRRSVLPDALVRTDIVVEKPETLDGPYHVRYVMALEAKGLGDSDAGRQLVAEDVGDAATRDEIVSLVREAIDRISSFDSVYTQRNAEPPAPRGLEALPVANPGEIDNFVQAYLPVPKDQLRDEIESSGRGLPIDLTDVDGIGPTRAEALEEIGVFDIFDYIALEASNARHSFLGEAVNKIPDSAQVNLEVAAETIWEDFIWPKRPAPPGFEGDDVSAPEPTDTEEEDETPERKEREGPNDFRNRRMANAFFWAAQARGYLKEGPFAGIGGTYYVEIKAGTPIIVLDKEEWNESNIDALTDSFRDFGFPPIAQKDIRELDDEWRIFLDPSDDRLTGVFIEEWWTIDPTSSFEETEPEQPDPDDDDDGPPQEVLDVYDALEEGDRVLYNDRQEPLDVVRVDRERTTLNVKGGNNFNADEHVVLEGPQGGQITLVKTVLGDIIAWPMDQFALRKGAETPSVESLEVVPPEEEPDEDDVEIDEEVRENTRDNPPYPVEQIRENARALGLPVAFTDVEGVGQSRADELEAIGLRDMVDLALTTDVDEALVVKRALGDMPKSVERELRRIAGRISDDAILDAGDDGEIPLTRDSPPGDIAFDIPDDLRSPQKRINAEMKKRGVEDADRIETTELDGKIRVRLINPTAAEEPEDDEEEEDEEPDEEPDLPAGLEPGRSDWVVRADPGAAQWPRFSVEVLPEEARHTPEVEIDDDLREDIARKVEKLYDAWMFEQDDLVAHGRVDTRPRQPPIVSTVVIDPGEELLEERAFDSDGNLNITPGGGWLAIPPSAISELQEGDLITGFSTAPARDVRGGAVVVGWPLERKYLFRRDTGGRYLVFRWDEDAEVIEERPDQDNAVVSDSATLGVYRPPADDPVAGLVPRSDEGPGPWEPMLRSDLGPLEEWEPFFRSKDELKELLGREVWARSSSGVVKKAKIHRELPNAAGVTLSDEVFPDAQFIVPTSTKSDESTVDIIAIPAEDAEEEPAEEEEEVDPTHVEDVLEAAGSELENMRNLLGRAGGIDGLPIEAVRGARERLEQLAELREEVADTRFSDLTPEMVDDLDDAVTRSVRARGDLREAIASQELEEDIEEMEEDDEDEEPDEEPEPEPEPEREPKPDPEDMSLEELAESVRDGLIGAWEEVREDRIFDNIPDSLAWVNHIAEGDDFDPDPELAETLVETARDLNVAAPPTLGSVAPLDGAKELLARIEDMAAEQEPEEPEEPEPDPEVMSRLEDVRDRATALIDLANERVEDAEDLPNPPQDALERAEERRENVVKTVRQLTEKGEANLTMGDVDGLDDALDSFEVAVDSLETATEEAQQLPDVDMPETPAEAEEQVRGAVLAALESERGQEAVGEAVEDTLEGAEGDFEATVTGVGLQRGDFDMKTDDDEDGDGDEEEDGGDDEDEEVVATDEALEAGRQVVQREGITKSDFVRFQKLMDDEGFKREMSRAVWHALRDDGTINGDSGGQPPADDGDDEQDGTVRSGGPSSAPSGQRFNTDWSPGQDVVLTTPNCPACDEFKSNPEVQDALDTGELIEVMPDHPDWDNIVSDLGAAGMSAPVVAIYDAQTDEFVPG